MQTRCNPTQYEFSGIGRRPVFAGFDGGRVSSDGGALLLKKADEAVDLLRRLGACFTDDRLQEAVEFPVRTLVAQRVMGIALGYEDLNDHEQLRYDSLLGAVIGKLDSGRAARRGRARARSTAWNCSTRRGIRAITRSGRRPSRSKACSSICSWNRSCH